MIDVTVGISAYNSSEFIAQAVESVLSQSGPSLELIVIDDGSTDGTADIVAQYAVNDPRVRVHQKENAGLGASRNDVIRLAAGRYIHFMDGDDYMGTNFLDAMVSRADKLNADLILSSYYEVSQNDFSIVHRGLPTEIAHTAKAFHWSERPSVLLSRTPVWDRLYRRQFLYDNKINFIVTGAEDIPFSWHTLLSADRIGTVWTPYFYYRVRQGSLTGGLNLIDDVFLAVQVALNFAKTNKKWNVIRPYFFARSLSEIGYLLIKARSGFVVDTYARHKYFTRLIETFRTFDGAIPPKVAQYIDPLYFELYSAVRGGLTMEELDQWFATHISPYAPKTRRGRVIHIDTSQFKAVVRFGLKKLIGRA